MLAVPTAHADMPDDPQRFFADCAGRMSAELSFRWMFSDPSADQIEDLRRATLDVLGAMTAEGQEARVMAWRVEARSAHSALLSQGTFRGAEWAVTRAAENIAHCTQFIVGPTDVTTGAPLASVATPSPVATALGSR